MKTNVIMESVKDRELFGVIIHQNTKDSMLSLTDLQEAYTHARVLNGWKTKGEIQHIINGQENAERIYYVLFEQKLINCEYSQFMDMVKKNGMVKVLKEFGVYRTTGRGENKKSVCNPYIWVLVAMELNPMMYAKVVTWLTDTLILNRIEAGNFYKELSSALYKLPEKIDYPKLAETLNIKVFGKHELGIRNKGSKEELEKLYILEANIAFAINKGYLKTQNDVIKAISEY
ncbi:MAG: hypothetical protein MJZ37_00435 [Bacilli bacterium]|nr:hypothetical protein [Bacilli bacterium]